MRRAPGLALAALAAACGATGADGGGDRDLPSAGVGPFRALEAAEVKSLAPFVFEDPAAGYHDPAVLRAGSEAWLYAAGAVAPSPGAPARDVVVRTRADDGRTFFGTAAHFGNRPRIVLEPDAPWEGGAVGDPAVVRAGGGVHLYYAGRDGIGLARSADGLVFVKEPAPVLVAEPAAAWEASPPRAPSVVVLPDGSWRMFYAAGGAIGEASSADGLTWRRVGEAPALAPGAAFDAAGVGDPCASTRTTSAGRLVVRVLYTATDAAGTTSIGLAARFGAAGPFVRQTSPTFSGGRGEASPALLELDGSSFLYFHRPLEDGTRPPYLGVGAAFAPGARILPPAGDYPAAP